MHINMCVKAILHGRPAAVGESLLVLLDKVTSICAEEAKGLAIVTAINQALPGTTAWPDPLQPLLTCVCALVFVPLVVTRAC